MAGRLHDGRTQEVHGQQEGDVEVRRKFNEENDGAMGKRIKLLKDAAAPVMAIIIFLLAVFGAFGLGWLIHS